MRFDHNIGKFPGIGVSTGIGSLKLSSRGTDSSFFFGNKEISNSQRMMREFECGILGNVLSEVIGDTTSIFLGNPIVPEVGEVEIF